MKFFTFFLVMLGTVQVAAAREFFSAGPGAVRAAAAEELVLDGDARSYTAAASSSKGATGPASITMDENSGLYTITWLGTPDRILIRWKLIPVQGEIYACGNYALRGHSMRRLSRKALRDVVIRMDDKIIMEDVSYFPELRSEDDLIGGNAACKGTGVPVPRDRGHRFSIGSKKDVYRD